MTLLSSHGIHTHHSGQPPATSYCNGSGFEWPQAKHLSEGGAYINTLNSGGGGGGGANHQRSILLSITARSLPADCTDDVM